MAIALDPQTIERDAVRADTEELATYLQAELGQQLTAYLSGLRDPKMVGRWAAGKTEPRDQAKLRLRYAFQVTRMVADAFGSETAKAWLVGSNTRLDDEAPASVIRAAETPDDLRFVVPAARAFAGAVD